MPLMRTSITGAVVTASLVAAPGAFALAVPTLPSDVQQVREAVTQDAGAAVGTIEQVVAQVAPATRVAVGQAAQHAAQQTVARTAPVTTVARSSVARTQVRVAATAAAAPTTVRRTRVKAQRTAEGSVRFTTAAATELGAQIGALLAGGEIVIPHWARGGGKLTWSNQAGCLAVRVQGLHPVSFSTGC